MEGKKLLYKKESYIIQGGAFEIYKQFRNRHKEKVYLRAYIAYLQEKGLTVEREKQIPVYFNGKKVGVYIPDLVVNGRIFIELKCKPRITKEDIKQFVKRMGITREQFQNALKNYKKRKKLEKNKNIITSK